MKHSKRNRIIVALIDLAWWFFTGICAAIILGGAVWLAIWLHRGGFWT